MESALYSYDNILKPSCWYVCTIQKKIMFWQKLTSNQQYTGNSLVTKNRQFEVEINKLENTQKYENIILPLTMEKNLFIVFFCESKLFVERFNIDVY